MPEIGRAFISGETLTRFCGVSHDFTELHVTYHRILFALLEFLQHEFFILFARGPFLGHMPIVGEVLRPWGPSSVYMSSKYLFGVHGLAGSYSEYGLC